MLTETEIFQEVYQRVCSALWSLLNHRICPEVVYEIRSICLGALQGLLAERLISKIDYEIAVLKNSADPSKLTINFVKIPWEKLAGIKQGAMCKVLFPPSLGWEGGMIVSLARFDPLLGNWFVEVVEDVPDGLVYKVSIDNVTDCMIEE